MLDSGPNDSDSKPVGGGVGISRTPRPLRPTTAIIGPEQKSFRRRRPTNAGDDIADLRAITLPAAR